MPAFPGRGGREPPRLFADGQHRRDRSSLARRGIPGVRRFGETCRSGQRRPLAAVPKGGSAATTGGADHQARRARRFHPGARPDAGYPAPSRRRPDHVADDATLCRARRADEVVRRHFDRPSPKGARSQRLARAPPLASARPIRPDLRFPDLGPVRHLCLALPAGSNAGMVRNRLAVFSPARQSAAGPAAHDGPPSRAIADGGDLPRLAGALAAGCGISASCARRQTLCRADSGLVAAPLGEALAGKSLRRAGDTD